MARKLNKNLVGILVVFGMLLLAVAGFVLLSNLPGQDPTIYEQQAVELDAEGQFESATKMYLRAYHKDPVQNPEYLVMAAHSAIEDGKIGGARELISQARVRDSHLKSAAELATSLQFELAQLGGGSQQWTRCLEEAQRLLSLDNQSALGHQALGESYIRLRNSDSSFSEKGEAALKKALELDPANTEVVNSLTILFWALAGEKEGEGKTEEAEAFREAAGSLLADAIRQCLETEDKESLFELKKLSALFQIRGGDQVGGVAQLEELVGADPKIADCHLMLARVYAGGYISEVEKDLAKAEKILREGLEIDPEDGRVYDLLGDIISMMAAGAESEEDAARLMSERVSLYTQALETIEHEEHFRNFRDNQYRIQFISYLFDFELRGLSKAKTEEEREIVFASAEAWIDRMKDEVSAESTDVRLVLARLYNARGDYVAATKEAEAADRNAGNRNKVQIQRLLAELYMRQGQWGSAKRALSLAVRMRPYSPIFRVAIARVCLKMGQPAEALQHLNPTDPQSLRDSLQADVEAKKLRIEAYRQLGQLSLAKAESKSLGQESLQDKLRDAKILLLEEKHTEAEQALTNLMKEYPDDLAALEVLLRLYQATDRMDTAREIVRNLLEQEPDNREYKRFELLVMEGDEAGREEAYITYLNDEKDDFTRSTSLATYHARRGDFDEAIRYLDEAEKLQPENTSVIEQQFRIALNTENWERAESYVVKHGELNIDGAEGNIAQGRLAIAKGEYDSAIELIKTGLQKFPSNSLGWTYLAEAYQSSKRVADAKSVLLRALDINPTNSHANRMMASFAIQENDEITAGRYLSAALRANPNDKWVKKQLQLLAEKKNPEVGIRSREARRANEPENVENLVLLARLYANSSVAQYDKAAEAYGEAFRISNNDLAIAREMTGFYSREEVNRPEEGEQLLRKLLEEQEEEKDKASVAVLLGRFFESQKAVATADRYFRMAVSYSPTVEVLREAAQFYTRVNRLRVALEYYQRIKKQTDDNEALQRSARLRIIGLLLAVGDLDTAREDVEAFVDEYPGDSQGLIYLGAYHRVGGDIKKAKQAFDSHLERDPDNAAALWQRGQMYILMGKWNLAISDLSRSKSFKPGGFGYSHRVSLANTLLEVGREEEAIAELRSIIDEKPEQTVVAEALLSVYQSATPPRYAEAENLIYTYMRQNPKSDRWPFFIGQLGEQVGDWNKAIEGYRKAAELSHYNPGTVSALLRAYKRANQPRDIIRCVTEKLSTRLMNTMPNALAALAWSYVKVGEQNKGLQAYDQALAVAGGDFSSFATIVGEMVSVFGKEVALERAQSRAKNDPGNVDNKKGLVHLLFINGEQEAALETCREVAELAVRDEDIVFAELGQAMLLGALDRHEEAKAKYEVVLKLNPRQPLALNNLAYLLSEKMHNPAEALPYAEQAKRANPNGTDVLDTLGWVLFQNGRDGEAVGMLLRALEIDRDNFAASYHLGVVHKSRGELEEARFRLEEALDVAKKAEGGQRYLPKIEKALKELEDVGR